METSNEKPVVVIEFGGNIFGIMGACKRAARKAGWSQERIDAFLLQMKSGDYDNALAVVAQHFEIED